MATHLKIGLIIIVVAVATAGGYLFFRSPEKQPIRIGALITLSGPASNNASIGDGLQIAVDEVNELGGINGRPLELIIADSQSDPAVGKQAFEQIEAAHHPDLYISITSAVSLAVAPLAEKYQVPLVGLVVSAENFTKNSTWLFRYYISTADEAKVAATNLVNLRVRHLDVLYQDDAYGAAGFEKIRHFFEKPGRSVTGIGYNPKQPEFEQKVRQLSSSEAVFIIGFRKTITQAVTALREAKYPGIISASSGLEPSPAMEGVYTAAPIIYNPNYAFVNELRQKYERAHHEPLNHYVVNGYDFIKLLAGLMEDRPVNRNAIREALVGGFIHNGLFGSFKVEQGERDIYFPLYPARVVNGKLAFQ